MATNSLPPVLRLVGNTALRSVFREVEPHAYIRAALAQAGEKQIAIVVVQAERPTRSFWPVEKVKNRALVMLVDTDDGIGNMYGPEAFDQQSLAAACTAAKYAVVVAVREEDDAYHRAVTLSHILFCSVVVVETTLDRQDDWVVALKKAGCKADEIFLVTQDRENIPAGFSVDQTDEVELLLTERVDG